MHSTPTFRRLARLAAGTVVAGTALAVLPGLASADTVSTCTYDRDSHNVVVTDRSGADTLQLVRKNALIMVADSPVATPQACFSAADMNGSHTPAEVGTTARIAVFAAPTQVAGGYTIDLSKGKFTAAASNPPGAADIPITLDTTGVPIPELTVIGTPERDFMSVAAGGKVVLDFDANADVVPLTRPKHVWLKGGGGDDELDSAGYIFATSDVPVELEGDAGNDHLVLGGKLLFTAERGSVVRGGADDDTLFTSGHSSDGVSGGPGVDAATVDSSDVVLPDVETKTVVG